jgi:hypothetical protein
MLVIFGEFYTCKTKKPAKVTLSCVKQEAHGKVTKTVGWSSNFVVRFH